MTNNAEQAAEPTSSPRNAEQMIALLRDVFERRGADSYLGEDVTMSQHMLQSAALAAAAGLDDAVVAGALLHDIGHYINDFPESLGATQDRRHQLSGAAILDGWFPQRTVACVRGHVGAKRYLCAIEDGYLHALSDASIESLALQGGPMSPSECDEFAQSEHLEAMLSVRRFDDAGKDPKLQVPTFSAYMPMLEHLVRTQLESPTAATRT
jgi:[1-hydroxy-2-(trimethylamino)ethyl]phosphonate dioxygenase